MIFIADDEEDEDDIPSTVVSGKFLLDDDIDHENSAGGSGGGGSGPHDKKARLEALLEAAGKITAFGLVSDVIYERPVGK